MKYFEVLAGPGGTGCTPAPIPVVIELVMFKAITSNYNGSDLYLATLGGAAPWGR